MSDAALALLKRVAPFIAIAAIAAALWLMWGTISAQKDEIGVLKEHAVAVAAQLKKMAANQAQADQHGKELAVLQDQFRSTLGQRAIDIRNLQNDLEELRTWAPQPLPDSIVRLRQRPAITGAAAYAEYLSTHQPVHVVGQQPPDGGRPQPAAGADGK